MRVRRNGLIAGTAVLVAVVIAYAQAPKPGLYEVTNRMTWQQSPFPEGMQSAPGSEGPHTARTCITRGQIEKFNGPKPEAHGGCEIGNIRKHEKGMTAEIHCTGSMKGKGTVESTWVDSGHSRSKVHFTGAMQMGQDSKPVEWTVESESTFKGPDCGEVKPSSSD